MEEGMRVVIVGVGSIGGELANRLSSHENNELVLIDLDKERCDELSQKIDALVLHGDGTDPDILKKAQLAEADALVAATGTDAINTVIAMLGHRMEVENIVVKLNGVGLRSACNAIGVKRIVAPTISAAAEMLSSIYGAERVDFSVLTHGGMRLVELEAGRQSGSKISDLQLPDGALLVAVIRQEETLIPRPGLKLEKEDQLIILAENEDLLNKTRKILGIEKGEA
jgi:trk system potassium uptake protein TrkA